MRFGGSGFACLNVGLHALGFRVMLFLVTMLVIVITVAVMIGITVAVALTMVANVPHRCYL